MLDWLKLVAKVLYDRRARKRLVGFRPVVMCLVTTHERDCYLLIAPKADPSVWILPQEGLKPNETIEDGSVRCLHEELGVGLDQIHFRKSIWIGDRVFTDRKGERDLELSLMKMQGKTYYAALILVDRGIDLSGLSVEVADVKWCSPEELPRHVETNVPDKAKIIRDAFAKLGIDVDLQWGPDC